MGSKVNHLAVPRGPTLHRGMSEMALHRPTKRSSGRIQRSSDDADAIDIDLRALPDLTGSVFHFSELRPGDMFIWPEIYDAYGGMIPAKHMLYYGSGSYAPVNDLSDINEWDPTSGMLVEVRCRLEDGDE